MIKIFYTFFYLGNNNKIKIEVHRPFYLKKNKQTLEIVNTFVYA